MLEAGEKVVKVEAEKKAWNSTVKTVVGLANQLRLYSVGNRDSSNLSLKRGKTRSKTN